MSPKDICDSVLQEEKSPSRLSLGVVLTLLSVALELVVLVLKALPYWSFVNGSSFVPAVVVLLVGVVAAAKIFLLSPPKILGGVLLSPLPLPKILDDVLAGLLLPNILPVVAFFAPNIGTFGPPNRLGELEVPLFPKVREEPPTALLPNILLLDDEVVGVLPKTGTEKVALPPKTGGLRGGTVAEAAEVGFEVVSFVTCKRNKNIQWENRQTV